MSKQKWINVKDKLPKNYGDVLCYTADGSIIQLVYNPKYQLFNVSFDNVEHAIRVAYWIPLPAPPEEV